MSLALVEVVPAPPRLGRVVARKLKVASYVKSLVSWVVSEAETWGQMILNYFIHFVSLFWVWWVPFCAGYSRKCLHFEYADWSNQIIDYSLCCIFFFFFFLGNKSKVQAFWNFSGIHNRDNPSYIVTWHRIFFPHFKTYFFKGLDFFSGFDWSPPPPHQTRLLEPSRKEPSSMHLGFSQSAQPNIKPGRHSVD